jgi:diguanylate cyclase (GGDEF)-like protein/PAS domain S-box-containing protein
MLVSANAATAALFGYPLAHLEQLPFTSLVPGGGGETGPQLLARLAEAPPEERELDGMNARGEPFPLSVSVAPVVRPGERLHVCILRDLTEQRRSQAHIHRLAHHDPLTGLENRNALGLRLERQLAQARRSHQPMAVLFIDLDHFKKINDSHGHEAGDQLLLGAATRMKDLLRDVDTLARLGGDEFIVLLEDVDGARGARMVAEKLMALFERPLQVAGHELFVTGSVGISLFPQDATDLNILIRNADVAMYQAKARGRNGYQFYAPSMDGEGIERLRMEALLRRAIERDEMRIAYQPQVDLSDGSAGSRLVGVEALVRWHNAELGEVAPSRFIPLAEDIGFIGQLGAWVLEEACRQMVAWDRAGLAVPKMAVNLSGRQFDRGSIADLVGHVLRETGLAPRRLQLEVTESVIMNTGDALATINELHAIGVELAIDDFGTGYSSLAYLKQLPVQTLKIDRSFIRDISSGAASDANDEAIAIAIIQLGKSMELSVIAEGVESEEQGAFLLRHGCSLAQGYLYGRPMAPDRVLEQWRPKTDARHEQSGTGQRETGQA